MSYSAVCAVQIFLRIRRVAIAPTERTMEKSFDEVSSWLTENGFAQYASKFHGKWAKIIANSLSALFID